MYLKFCNELKKILKKIFCENLIAAAVFGSYARLCPKKGSDVDLMIILKKKL